jgi:serine/threonine protein phosphatase PrpC
MGEPILVAAVADGHGSGRHDLSHCGAALAVQAAVGEVIASLPLPEDGEAWRPVPAQAKGPFQDRVTARWREYVMADAGRRGVQDPEGGIGPEILTRYGTTLLVAFLDGTEGWVGQIGDGDILIVRPEGNIETLLPRDEALVGTVTYSLSSREPAELWRTARFPVGPGGLLIMATDGLPDSFENPDSEFRVFARSLWERVASFGIEQIGSALPGWLDGYSRDGSGDDMTLVLVFLNPSVTGGKRQKPGETDEEQVGGAGSAPERGTMESAPEGGVMGSGPEGGGMGSGPEGGMKGSGPGGGETGAP